MPAGYLGGSAETTAFGRVYVGAALLLGALAIAARLGGRRWSPIPAATLLVGNVTVFLPALASDPIIAGGVVLWHLLLAGRLLFPVEAARTRGPRPWKKEGAGQLDLWVADNRHALQHLLLVSLTLTVTVVGFGIGREVGARLVCFALDGVVIAWAIPLLRGLAKAGSRVPLVIVAPLVAAATFLGSTPTVLGWIGVFQALVLAVLLHRSAVTVDVLQHFIRRPALLVAASFAALIAVGTMLLSFPAASAKGGVIGPVDALFTATSAACVTGLVVVDTPTAFSGFGHGVILALIQVGGWNIMVLSAFSALLLGRGLGLRGERALGELLDLPTARTAGQLAAFIVSATLLIEAVGAVLLTPVFHLPSQGWLRAAWEGTFHSVSALCNAGFSLHPDSLIRLQARPGALLVFAALIVLGGLGFSVLAAGWNRLRGRHAAHSSLHVRLVLWTTVLLITGAATWFIMAEWNGALDGMSLVEKLVNGLFLAITPRTAGFNSVSLSLLSPVSVVLLLLLMFVGASPGGTGGGIKTTTTAVLLGSIAAISRGESRVRLFRRTVPLEIVYRSAAIAVIAVLVAFAATASLLVVEGLPLEPALFEVVSALGTVGLSLGVTPSLGAAGKLILVVVMFVGRIGPLALALILARATSRKVAYPEARIMVG